MDFSDPWFLLAGSSLNYDKDTVFLTLNNTIIRMSSIPQRQRQFKDMVHSYTSLSHSQNISFSNCEAPLCEYTAYVCKSRPNVFLKDYMALDW